LTGERKDEMENIYVNLAKMVQIIRPKCRKISDIAHDNVEISNAMPHI